MNGKLMKERREELGMTQMQLAVAVGASSVTGTAPTSLKPWRTAAFVPPDHHAKSSTVPGPKARSQRRARSAQA